MEPDREKWLDASDGAVGTSVRELIKRIERFCELRNWKHSTFSKQAAGSDTWFHRLKVKGRVQAFKMLEVERYLDEHEPKLESKGDK